MEKNAHFGQTACKIHYYNLCIRLVHEKFAKPFQSHSTVEIPRQARRGERLSHSKLIGVPN